MASINGDWFHSRSSSNISELLAIRTLVLESQKLEYIGYSWSEDNQMMNQLASTIGIQNSTMRTKIRAMIRFGFIKDDNPCPLKWTRMGELWNDLFTVRNLDAAKKIYELILTISLSIYAFNDSPQQYSINPSRGELPLKTLFNLLDRGESISLSEFQALVDGTKTGTARNNSYWKKDLINTGLFDESGGRLIYTNKYPQFINELKTFTPDPALIDGDWVNIRENPLIDISPFKNSLKNIFLEIATQQNITEQVSDEILSEPIIDIVSEEEERLTPEIDILSHGTRITQINQRVRNATWALRIKNKYFYKCAVKNCDVDGKLFVEAAHIKPDNVEETGTPHRTHILNGLCLCRLCHITFEKGFFSLTDDCRIIISQKISDIVDQNLKRVLTSSENYPLKSRTDGRIPLNEFIRYHREEKFKGQ